MKRFCSLSILVLSLFIVNIAAYAARKADTLLGEQLEQGLFHAAKEKNWAALDTMLAPDVQSVNADKIRNRNELIDYIKSIRFEDYRFSDFTTSVGSSGNILIVTYEMSYAEKIGTLTEAGKKTKNLSVWQNNKGKWQWIAHAVLD